MIIPVLTQHYPMLQRNLLYTGVTRGKRLVVLVGQKKAVAIAVRNASSRRRWSKLGEWLRRPHAVSEHPPVSTTIVAFGLAVERKCGIVHVCNENSRSDALQPHNSE